MKYLTRVALPLVSVACLVSMQAAHAGPGCAYSSEGVLAANTTDTSDPLLADGDNMDPELLALLRKQREAEQRLLQQPVVHN